MSNFSNNYTTLDALSEAVRAVTTDLSLERVLRRLAEISARLVNARYAALGVPDENGGLEAFYTFGMTEKQIGHMDHYPLGLGLLGVLMADHQNIRLEDMTTDSRSAGFCAAHPKMTSFLGVPVLAKGKHLGSLYLCDRVDGRPFTEEDERLTVLLAAQAAIAIENARLSSQIQALAIVKERDRIAMELHDGIIQSIYAVGMKLDVVRGSLKHLPENNGQTAAMETQLDSATSGLNTVIEDLRKYILDLKNGLDFSFDLQRELREIVAGFQSVSDARLVMDVAPGFSRLTKQMVHTLAQVLRESLSNIVRHADATEVYVDLIENVREITLTVSDNGKGFVPAEANAGNGLLNMNSRADALLGALTIDSQPGRGSTVTLILPK